MSDPYIGEIRMFGGTFAPAGWAFCDGQLMPISENDALFTLIGTTYGGDGQETFGLPNLQSRVPMHMGTGPDGTTYQIGEMAGTEQETLTVQQIPNHTHPMLVSTDQATSPNPSGNVLAAPLTATPFFASTPGVTLSPSSVVPIGGSQPHENMQPFLCVSFIISLFGIFPHQ
jgi:microcystin-dependent protein